MSLSDLDLAKSIFSLLTTIGWSVFDVATSSRVQLARLLSIGEDEAYKLIVRAQEIATDPTRRIYYQVEGEEVWTPPEPEQPPAVVSTRIRQCIESANEQQRREKEQVQIYE